MKTIFVDLFHNGKNWVLNCLDGEGYIQEISITDAQSEEFKKFGVPTYNDVEG